MAGHMPPAARATPPVPRRRHALNIVAAVLGNALEFYDFSVYAVFATALARAFFPTSDANNGLLLAVATFGVGFFARPVGAIVIGAYADRHGRKPAMTLTILLMALGTGIIGLLPTYGQIGVAAPLLLVLARLVQGFSTGGEMGPTTTFLLEASPRGRLGFFGSWQLASQNMGSIISGLLGVILALALPADTSSGWGWRIPFLFGILIAPVGFYIRRNLPETLATEQTLASMRAVLSEILARHWLKVLLGILVISGATVSQYFLIYTTSYAIVTLGFPKTVAMAANLTIGVSGTMFAVLGGLLADRYGLKTISILPRLLLAVLLYPALMLVVAENSPTIFLAMVALLMALQAMSGAAGITLIPVIFPAATRTAGLSIAYAFGVSIFGGSAQFVFTWIINATGDKLSWVWYIVAMNIVSLLAVAALRVPRALAIEGLATQDARQAAVLAGARR